MTRRLHILRAGPLTTVQDAGRYGLLAHGISASGPMDRDSHALAGRLAGAPDDAGIEFTRAGLDLKLEGADLHVGWAGGNFRVEIDGVEQPWPGGFRLRRGSVLAVTPGTSGNYGYLRFGATIHLPKVMGSRATSTRAMLGGLDGRALKRGDILTLTGTGLTPETAIARDRNRDRIRFVWGIHAENFSRSVRERFVASSFRVTAMMDRMGVRLADESRVFAGQSILSLVSDPILPGDIQILGDGTPIVLMRDHQPTGGYPRIGTVITADFDRFAQLRAGEQVAFDPVSVDHAQHLLRSSQT